MNVNSEVSNITGDNVTVYVDGDYSGTEQYLFSPHITELHMRNNEVGALWNPTLNELPNTLNAAIMKQAKIGILYDGWIDLECTGPRKPYGSRRYAEVLGYDIYARMGERYVNGSYEIRGGLLKEADPINYTWALMHMYRALGVEKVKIDARTQSVPKGYDVNQSPIVQTLTIPMTEPYLKDGITQVSATRTNTSEYLNLAETDGIISSAGAGDEDQYISVAQFCTLVAELMHLYGEPVLTDQETYMLLEAYGRTLPYGLPSKQLEAVKYLLVRGVIDNGLDWRANITFEDAANILMRVKDKDSRLTFKEIQLTTNPSLLKMGYYPTEVGAEQAPLVVLDDPQPYAEYTQYDYFVQCVEGLEFRSDSGYLSTPFVCNGANNADGVLQGSEYVGRVRLGGREFYHFRIDMTVDSAAVGGSIYINTAVADDTPYMYALPVSANRNSGGVYLYTGTDRTVITGTIKDWEWLPLDNERVAVPSEYCDYERKSLDVQTAKTQTGLFDTSSYGFTVRVHKNDLAKVSFKDVSGRASTLESIMMKETPVKLKDGMSITRKDDTSMYVNFLVKGCNNKNTLSEIFTCAAGSAMQSFPAFSKNNDQYLVSVDYLKAIGVVWDFTKTSDTSYYIGVKSMDMFDGTPRRLSAYTDVYIGTSGAASYVIRGTQLTLYPADMAVVWESDTGYFVDYAAILGITKAVSFTDKDGVVTLSGGSQIDPVKMQMVRNINNEVGTRKPSYEWLPVVDVQDASGKKEPYIYAPITYPLANWLVVDNQVDMRSGIFSFFPTSSKERGNGVQALRDYLGVELGGSSWGVNYTGGAALVSMEVTKEKATFKLGKGVSFGKILYSKELNAYLIRPNHLKSGETFSEFAGDITSIAYTIDGQFVDWNNNLYKLDGEWRRTYAIHLSDSKGTQTFCDLSAWTGSKGSALPVNEAAKFLEDWIPAPVGVPGIIGYPASTSSNFARNPSVVTYSGAACLVRNGEGTSLFYNIEGEPADTKLTYAIMHATPSKAWLQSSGFTFQYLATSPLGQAAPSRPNLTKGDALGGFDWDTFLKNVGLQNADDWLTIAIIAVLNLLPRVLMFAMFALITLAMIADVKAWQVFCDKVMDPYRILTLGRQNVHTIRMKTVFLYSIIALALFGLFQNGTILSVIAWLGRAVTGILGR